MAGVLASRKVKRTETYDVLLYHDLASGLILAEVPDVPGCVSQGTTPDEARANIKEALELHLGAMLDDGETLPPHRDYLLEPVTVSIGARKTA